MNSIIENILTRRSTRDFSSQQVPRHHIETLVEAALYAPSGMCQQSWKFTAILDQALIAQLAAAIAQVLNRDNYNFYGATALIIPSNLADSRFGRDDNACALQNIFLAAHSLDIASVWINQLNGICDHPQIRPLLDQMGIPADHIVYGLAALGYDNAPPKGKIEKTGIAVILD